MVDLEKTTLEGTVLVLLGIHLITTTGSRNGEELRDGEKAFAEILLGLGVSVGDSSSNLLLVLLGQGLLDLLPVCCSVFLVVGMDLLVLVQLVLNLGELG